MLDCKSRRLDKVFVRKKEPENNFVPEIGLKWEKAEAKRVLELQCNSGNKNWNFKKEKKGISNGP